MKPMPTLRSRVFASRSPWRFPPQVEWLESRQQPGETFGFGLLGGALAGTALDLFTLPLGAVPPDQQLVRDYRPALTREVVEITTLTALGEHPANGGENLAATDHQILPALIQPPTHAGDFDVLLEDMPVLPVAIQRPHVAALSGLKTPNGGSIETAAAVGAWSSATVVAAPEAPSSGPTEPNNLSRFVPLGGSAPRLDPNSMAFDPWSGAVAIRGDGADHTIQEALTSRGFVEVRLDGQPHSSDPASTSFDPLLVGATATRLTSIRLDGAGGQDTLILGAQQLAGGLQVNAPGAKVVTEDVAVGGQLAVQASDITVRGTLRGSAVTLAATGWASVEDTGKVVAGNGDAGGRLTVFADKFVNTGQLHADGATGGQITVAAGNILNAGPVSANGTNGGGTVRIAFTGAYIDTVAAVTSANGSDGPGGHVTIEGGTTGRLFSSGRQQATGSVGGTVDLLGREVVLDGGAVDTSGETDGGAVRVGGDFHGGNPAVANADTVTVTPATTIRADALRTGEGGRVAIWSDADTAFQGAVSARGGPADGAGGLIEVSGQGSLNYGGTADAGASSGQNGTLLLDPKNLIIGAAPVGIFPQFDLIDPYPTAGGGFGYWIRVLANGNVLVANPNDNFGGNKAGAVYLFNGLNGALISSLVGSHPSDQAGITSFGSIGFTGLSNGNYVVLSTSWNSNRGAVTWGSSTLGTNGIISEVNSLVGSNPNDQVGYNLGVTPLSNGNYVVRSEAWNSGRGAITWGSGTTGISGFVSVANSLMGSNPNDLLGYDGIFPLSNGNYVIASRFWNGNRGAVTWGNGSTGTSGVVSSANSLIGANPGDLVGIGGGVISLNNGNYLAVSSWWNGNRGAVTWGNGSTGTSGIVSSANSLVGADTGDYINLYITPLSNGNYVVAFPSWNSERGAVAWGNGRTGTSGTFSAANSLIGSNPYDFVGSSVTPLSNGNYVVRSPAWNGHRGAATWANGSTGLSGFISDVNSLVGINTGDSVGACFNVPCVVALSNSNYVVRSPAWNGNRGSVTWANGNVGITGTISVTNSLIGSSPGDLVGEYGVTLLTNGNYVVQSPDWNGGRGAATWGKAASATNGLVSDLNSLVGSNPQDQVSLQGVISLNNGNYLVQSQYWNGIRGAMTWGNGSTGVSGPISEANSLLGSDPGDQVGNLGVTLLTNGNYVVQSSFWNGRRGAVTWANRATGVSGIVSATNSLIGSNPGDLVGSGGVSPLSNSNYVVRSPNWNGGRGAATWGDGTTGVPGAVSAANSLVGSQPGDDVGGGVTGLSNGNYVVQSPFWNGYRGAVTWGYGVTGVNGVVSVTNSFIGSTPRDFLGYNLIPLSNGNYLVFTPGWTNGSVLGAGAVTWVNGMTGQTLDDQGIITLQNSLIGRATNTNLQVFLDSMHQSFLASFPSEGTGRITVGLTDPNQFTYARAQSQTVTLTPDFLTATLNTGTAVALQASNDITVYDPVTVHADGHGGALTLQAGRSILLNASITTDNGPLTLIANDTRADGVVDSQRDPGNAAIVMAGGTTLDTGTAPLDIELRDGAGLTHADSRAINLQTLTAGSVTVVNNGPDAGSDLRLGPVTTSGPQTYSSPNGVTTVTADLTTGDSPITFTDSVLINDDVSVHTGSGTVNFAGAGTQTLYTGAGVSFGNLNHTGSGTLQLTSGLAVAGTFLQSAGTFDANDQPVTVGGAAIVTGGTYLAGIAPQTFAGGLILTDGTFASSTGPMMVSGGVTLTGGSFEGAGTVDQLTVYRGTVAPGATTPGVLSVAGAVAFNPLTTFSVLLDGTHAGRGYSRLRAAGPVQLGGSTLQLVLGFEPPVGHAFKILTAAAAGGIQGTFAGLPEGAIFSQGGYQFQITYQGGANGRGVVLTRLA